MRFSIPKALLLFLFVLAFIGSIQYALGETTYADDVNLTDINIAVPVQKKIKDWLVFFNEQTGYDVTYKYFLAHPLEILYVYGGLRLLKDVSVLDAYPFLKDCEGIDVDTHNLNQAIKESCK